MIPTCCITAMLYYPARTLLLTTCILQIIFCSDPRRLFIRGCRLQNAVFKNFVIFIVVILIFCHLCCFICFISILGFSISYHLSKQDNYYIFLLLDYLQLLDLLLVILIELLQSFEIVVLMVTENSTVRTDHLQISDTYDFESLLMLLTVIF